MAKKVTFTLDETTIDRLQVTAERLGRSKSQVVREAIAEYHERSGRLSERERRRLLTAFDRLLPEIPRRSPDEVDRELEQVRLARRRGERGGRGRSRA
jgi:hypothetical protein